MRPPPSVPARLLYILGGVLIPAACFALVGLDPSFGPRDRQGRWQAFVLLLFHREANWGFGLLLLAAAVALVAAISRPATPLVRVLVLGGAVVSATYVVLGALSEFHKLFLIVDLAVFVLWLAFSRVLESRSSATALLVAFAALAVVALVGFLFLGVSPGIVLLLALAGGPMWSLLAYASLWRRIRPAPGRILAAWLAAYGAACAHAVVQASRLYGKLPETTGCYIATAAARGHRRLVGPWPSAQLLRLKAGELVLAQIAPRLHRLLRRAYDRVGPRVAARIRHPLAADVAYLLLKPLEWAVRRLLRG